MVSARRLLLLTAIAVVATPAVAQNRFGGAERITAARLEAHLRFFAHDLLEGRDTPSRGLDIAAHYLATQLALAGVKPGGENGTYFHTMMLERMVLDTANSRATLGSEALDLERELLVAASASANGFTATAPLRYVGTGQTIDASAKGKIVVANLSSQRGAATVMTNAQAQGAAGVLFIPSRNLLSFVSRSVGPNAGRYQPSFMAGAPDAARRMPAMYATPALVEKLFAGESATAAQVLEPNDNAPAAFDLNASKTLSVTLATRKSQVPTWNVIGIVEGTDPRLKNEFVGAMAHYDHVGFSPGRPDDTINNGADDNGSGTVALLEMAKAMAASGKPKRSVMFMFWSGEEKGLWGSRMFAETPLVPLDRFAAIVNMDMIGRSKAPGDTNPRNRDLSGPNEVFVMGPKQSSADLGNWLKTINDRFHKLELNGRLDEPNEPQRLFQRSDQAPFIQRGVPALVFFTGLHEDYHQVSDHVEKIDFKKLEKISQTIHAVLWTVATRNERPRLLPGAPQLRPTSEPTRP